MQPVAPPTKRIKADLDNEETVRKRRADLNKLKQKQQMRKPIPGVNPPGPPGPPGSIPGAVPLNRVRHSDIFPTVSEKVAPRTSDIPPPRAGNFPPPGARTGHALPSRRQHQAAEPVVRRLDQSFGQRKSPAPPPSSRSKSAPPSRPPPPPGPPPLAMEAPETTPSRSFSARPSPVTPGTKTVATPGGLKIPPMASSKETPPPPVSTPQVVPPMPQAVARKEVAGAFPPASSNGHEVVPLSLSIDLSQTESGPTVPPVQGQPTTGIAQKPRQDLIRNLHQFADSPDVSARVKPALSMASKNDSSLLRLEKQVTEHEKGKADALRKVAILEEQVQKLKEKGGSEEELGVLVQMAEKEGSDAALQWARGRVSGATPRSSSAAKVGFFSPLSPGLATPRSVTRKRIATPHPKRNQQEKGTSEDPGLFSESVKYVSFEYTSEHATFIVRRPYGKATESELWFQSGYTNSKQYEKTADVKEPHSLEIIAQISADGSTLSLHGSAFVRHMSSDVDDDWTEFGSVDEMGKPLGSITYIDKDANEKDYSLDEVFEGALAARENYCTSVASLAVGLKTKESSQGKATESSGVPAGGGFAAPVQKPQTAEVGVGTEDLPVPTNPPSNAEANDGNEADKMPEKPTGPAMDIDDDGSDVASVVLQSFVSFLVWIVKTLLFTIPFRIVSFTLLFLIAFALLSLVSLQLTDDHGAVTMGASFDSMFNLPGVV